MPQDYRLLYQSLLKLRVTFPQTPKYIFDQPSAQNANLSANPSANPQQVSAFNANPPKPGAPPPQQHQPRDYEPLEVNVREAQDLRENIVGSMMQNPADESRRA